MSSLLDTFLAGNPDASVGAVDGIRAPAEFPSGVELLAGQHLDTRSLLDIVVPDDMKAVTDAFVEVLTRGTGSATIRLAGDPEHSYRLKYLDLRGELGVVLRLVAPVNGSDPHRPPAPATSLPAAKPRLATLTRNEVGVILSADEATMEMLGWTDQELIGSSTLDLVHPEDQAKAVDNWMARLRRTSDETTRTRAIRLRYRRKDGTWIWLETSNEFGQGADGSTVAHAQLIDVSDEMAALDALGKSQHETAQALALLDTFESSAPVGFAFVDVDWRFVRVNDTFGALFDTSPADMLGRTPAEILPEAGLDFGALGREFSDKEHLANVEIGGTLSATGRLFTWLGSAYPVVVEGELRGYGVVLVDISERKLAEDRQSRLVRAAVEALSITVETRDPYTAGHQRGVAKLSAAIAAEIGLDASECEGIRIAGHIHDLGKVAIPAEILSKPGRLTPLEMAIVKTHSQVGYDIVSGIEFPWPVATMILQHHERLDGSGYPNGVGGDAILLGARIIAVADVVEAMAAHRPYRSARGLDAALDEISQGSGRLYDPEAVDACLKLFNQHRFAFALAS